MSRRTDKTQVLYLIGFGRSGSSILGNVLGQVDGWFHGGELRNFWNDGWISNRRCECGRQFWSCPLWSVVAADLQQSHPDLDPEAVVRDRDHIARTRHLTRWMMSPPTGSKEMTRLQAIFADLYGTIRRFTESSVVIDSTMSPIYGMLLNQVPSLDVTYLHLVRDPRAVAHSWRKQIMQEAEDGVPMRRYSVAGSSLKWAVENFAAERAKRLAAGTSMDVRFEDFVSRPQSIVEQIVKGVDGTGSGLVWEGRTVRIDAGHSVWGNPSRFARGMVQIRSDHRWANDLSKGEQMAVRAVAGPLMRRYGYS